VSEEHGPDLVRWYTRARKFPQLIGRTPDGARIPGGPYTVTQAVAAGVILVVGLNTLGIWARFGLLGNLLVLATVTWTAVWLLGRIPVGSRSPLSVATGLVHAVGAPSTGRLGGRAVRIRRPHRLRHTIVLARTEPTTAPIPAPAQVDAVPEEPTPGRRSRRAHQRPSEPAVAAPEEAETPPAAPQAAHGPRRAPLTGVQALLATHPTETETHR
jgi:hypothetical protein